MEPRIRDDRQLPDGRRVLIVDAAGGPWVVQLKSVLDFNRRPSGVRYWLRRSGRVERDQDAAIAAALRDVELVAMPWSPSLSRDVAGSLE